MSTCIVYTVIFGDYDILRPPLSLDSSVSYYCISEQARDITEPYSTLVKESKGTCRKSNRYYKLNSHLVFPDADITIYHDGNVELLCPPQQLIGYLGDADIAVIKHSQRTCLYDEARICQQWGLDNYETLKSQITRYRNEGMPRHNGLYCGFLLIRRNMPKTIEFNELWWNQVNNYSIRDQVSMPYVFWKLGIKPSVITGDIYCGPCYARHAIHRSK